jgi:LPS export ABC transporter protein LptC
VKGNAVNHQQRLRRVAAILFAMTVLVGVGSCRFGDRPTVETSNDAPQEEIEEQLTLDNFTLDQVDTKGNLLWRVNADQAIYSENQQTVEATNLTAEVYKDGEVIFQIRGDRGEVRLNGERLSLNGNIEATDVRTETEMKGEELTWTPEDEVLLIRDGFSGSNKNMTFKADEGRLSNLENRFEITGNVLINTRDPKLKITGDELVWLTEEDRITSDAPLRIQRLKGSNNTVTDQATGDRTEVDLANNIVSLFGNARIAVRDPVMDIRGETLVWDLNAEILTADAGIDVLLQQQQTTLTANQGELNIGRDVFYFFGNVEATTRKNQGLLTSDVLTWYNDTQNVEAEGNVYYEQRNPDMTTQGPRLTGTLRNQVFVVSGGRVTSEFEIQTTD